MRALCKSFSLITRRLLRSDNHGILVPRYLNKVIRARENAQLDYLKSVIEQKHSNWQTIKDNVLSKPGTMTKQNIDAVILKFILAQKEFDFAYSFANYLQISGNELNLGATNSILNFYYEYSRRNNPTEEIRKFIINTYKHLYDKHKVLDHYTSEALLKALCVIDEWKLSLKILDDIHLSSTPSHASYSVVIETLFRNNQKAKALEIIKKSLNDRRPLLDYAYDEWIKYVLRENKHIKDKEKYLDEICTHLADNYIKVSEKTAERIQETFTSLHWSATYTSVKRSSGQCICCHQTLRDIELSDEEFSLLQQNVKDKLIVGSDLFLKTSPRELDRFLKFIDRTAPYDIVLDGLNIAYTIGKSTYQEKLKAIHMVVDYFSKQNKKILLLGRKHMLKWKGSKLKELSEKTCTFFTEDLSQDDPYFITAAILSGANTDILSRDLLRGHKFLMKQEQLRLLFQRWQWKHQWMLYEARKKPILQAPLKFTPVAQKHASGWHIPYEKVVETEENYLNNGDPDCLAWLCINKNVDKSWICVCFS